ncbi:MAG: tyrosine-type recombinase/integrase [Gammaproteobacteria bacterium]
MNLNKVSSRDRLKPRREPYWHDLEKGRFIGYRPSKTGTGGTWIARFYDSNERKYLFHALGDYGNLPPADRYKAAKDDAVKWLNQVDAGGNAKPLTVRQVCEAYAEERPEARERFRRYVYADPIAKITVTKLTVKDVMAWRKRLERKPAKVSRSKHGTPVTRDRNPATVNRDMVSFKAALNQARKMGDVLSDFAWREVLKPTTCGGRREIYLNRDERRALLKHLPADAAAFVRGLCLLPLRVGTLAQLVVGDFDSRRNELTIVHDKANGDRRIVLPPEISALLKEQSRNKLPGAPLFTQANGKAWVKDAWKKPIKAAVKAAGLPPGTTAYMLRHSTITDLMTNGLDVATVAEVSGTSVLMIQKHYHHLQQQTAVDALQGLAL